MVHWDGEKQSCSLGDESSESMIGVERNGKGSADMLQLRLMDSLHLELWNAARSRKEEGAMVQHQKSPQAYVHLLLGQKWRNFGDFRSPDGTVELGGAGDRGSLYVVPAECMHSSEKILLRAGFNQQYSLNRILTAI